MMRYISAIFLLFVLFACSNEEEVTDNNNDETTLEMNFTISGEIIDGQNQPFYVEAQSQQGVFTIAEGKSDNAGKFTIEGNITGFGVYRLRMGETQNYVIPLTIVPNDHIKIKSSFEDFSRTPKVNNTAWSDVMTRYMGYYAEFISKQSDLRSNPQDLTPEQLNETLEGFKAPLDSFAVAEMKKNPANPFNIILSSSAFPSSAGFDEWDKSNLEVLKGVAAAYMKQYPDSPISAAMNNQTIQLQAAYDEHQKNFSGTRLAPEIKLNTPDGEPITLSSLRGQYVLIDFWASWCGPCRKENPNVVRIYNKYKNKGFTIFSVSLDKDANAWKAAIEKDGLIWPNHGSDLMQWESPLPRIYEFNGIPYTVLVDKEGYIIGAGLRGPALERKLEEIFSK